MVFFIVVLFCFCYFYCELFEIVRVNVCVLYFLVCEINVSFIEIVRKGFYIIFLSFCVLEFILL